MAMKTQVMRAAFLAGGLLLLSSAIAQTVSFAHEAAPASKVFAALSKQLGTKLQIGDPISKETLLLDVHDVPKQTLLNELATSLHGQWNGSILVRPKVLEQKLRADELAQRAEEFEKELHLKTDTVIQRPFNKVTVDQLAAYRSKPRVGEIANRQLMRELVPIHRLTAHLLRLFNGQHLARIEKHKAEYYSSQPHGAYRALPAEAAPFIEAFQKEHRIFEEAVASSGAQLQDQTGSGDIRFQLTAIDRDVIQATTYYGAAKVGDLGVIVLNPLPKPDASLLAKATTLKPPTFSTLGKELWDGLNTRGEVSPTEGLKNLMQHPEVRDPLAVTVGEVFDSLGNQLRSQIIAVIPESVVSSAYLQSSQAKSFNFRLFLLKAARSTRIQARDGWLRVTPRLFISELDEKTDRYALGQFFRDYFDKGKNTLEAEADYTHSLPDPLSGGVEDLYISYLSKTKAGFDQWWTHSSRQFLWVYGSLSGDQRQAVHASGIPVRDLTEEQQAYLLGAVAEQQGKEAGSFEEDERKIAGDWTLRGSSETAIRAIGSNAKDEREPYTVSEIAAQMLFKKLNVYPDVRDVFEQKHWRASRGESHYYALYKPGGGENQPLLALDDWQSEDEPVDSLDALPATYLEMLKSEYDRLSKMPPAQVYRLIYGD